MSALWHTSSHHKISVNYRFCMESVSSNMNAKEEIVWQMCLIRNYFRFVSKHIKDNTVRFASVRFGLVFFNFLFLFLTHHFIIRRTKLNLLSHFSQWALYCVTNYSVSESIDSAIECLECEMFAGFDLKILARKCSNILFRFLCQFMATFNALNESYDTLICVIVCEWYVLEHQFPISRSSIFSVRETWMLYTSNYCIQCVSNQRICWR